MVHGLKVAGVEINRKMLAELAISDPQGFTKLAELSKSAVNN
jgi:large subunit ribosomal protein L20